MTIEEYNQLLAKSRKLKRSKYGNKSAGDYQSRHERDRAFQLRALEQAGQISDLKEQVAFQLIPALRDADGHLIERACSYVADFTYRLPDGSLVVEDAKGFRTDVYRIKRKLMLHIHGIRIVES